MPEVTFARASWDSGAALHVQASLDDHEGHSELRNPLLEQEVGTRWGSYAAWVKIAPVSPSYQEALVVRV